MRASEYLKSSTQHLHRLVDQNRLMSRVVTRDLTQLEYAEILTTLHTWLSGLSPALDSIQLEPVYSIERKLKLIELDLQQLGLSFTSNPIEPVEERSFFYRLGVHYVIEGSSLGAQFIAPRVEQTLDRLDVTNFYRGYGDFVHQYWSETTSLLDRKLLESWQLELAVKGAQDAFQSLLEIINKDPLALRRAS